MKKVIAAILCISLLTGALSGCASEGEMAYSAMIKLLKSMNSVTEGETSIELSFSENDNTDSELSETSEKSAIADSELAKAFLKSDITGISLVGSMSNEKQQLHMALDYLSSDVVSGEFGDIIIVGEESYVNMTKMLKFISPLMWADTGNFTDYMSDFFTAVMDGREYVYSGNSGIWETDNELTETVNKLTNSFYGYMADMDVVTFSDDVYTFTLEGEAYRYVLTGILTDMKGSSGIFANAIISALGLANISLLDTSLPEASELSDELSGFFNKRISELNYNDASGLKLIGTVCYDKESKTYTQKLVFMEDDVSVFEIACSVADTEVNEITAPDMYLTHEEFDENLKDVSASLYNSNKTEDNKTLVYTTNESETIQPFVDEVLGEYTNLQLYDYTAKSGTVYSVPIIISESIEIYSDFLVVESPGMWQYIMSGINNGDTAKSFLEQYVQGNYNYGYDNPSNTNMTISPDESVAVMGFSYDHTENGKITMICIAMMTENGEDILLMNIDIYHDYMEDIDYTILSELSEIIEVNLSEFYSI